MALGGPEEMPATGGEGTPVRDFDQRAQLWVSAAEKGPASRASCSVCHMHSAPRQVCLSVGEAIWAGSCGRDYQQVMRFAQYRRAGQSFGELVVEFDLSRQKLESRPEMGAGPPGHSAPIRA